MEDSESRNCAQRTSFLLNVRTRSPYFSHIKRYVEKVHCMDVGNEIKSVTARKIDVTGVTLIGFYFTKYVADVPKHVTCAMNHGRIHA